VDVVDAGRAERAAGRREAPLLLAQGFFEPDCTGAGR
jgi:hypothetical protein